MIKNIFSSDIMLMQASIDFECQNCKRKEREGIRERERGGEDFHSFPFEFLSIQDHNFSFSIYSSPFLRDFALICNNSPPPRHRRLPAFQNSSFPPRLFLFLKSRPSSPISGGNILSVNQ